MHQQYLLQALSLAETRRGWCAPNPSVGAVIVKNGVVLATGCHWQAGKAHAEVSALQKLTVDETKNATLYVTLEPCCHYGKTPPCVKAIIEAGISAVYYAQPDPNPEVLGAGHTALNAAGVYTQQITLPEITEFYTSYVFRWQHQRPYLTAKIALSLDGKIAGLNGQPVQITSETTRVTTHQQRLRSDAIISTLRTVQMDDPSLNVRLNNAVIGKPIYLLDSQCALAPTAKIVTTANPLVIICGNTASESTQAAWRDRGVRVIPVAMQQSHLDLSAVIDFLTAEGLIDVWVECGTRALSAFLTANLIQTLHVCIAPKFLGIESTYAEFPVLNFVEKAKNIEIKMSDVDTIYTLKL